VALFSRSVLLSLFGGVLLGLFLLNDFSLIQTLKATYQLFSSLLHEEWILKTLAFAVMVGSIIELLQKSGSIDAFVNYMTQHSKIVTSPRSALLVSYIIGIVIFIESSITALIAGAVGRPLCDKEGVSHAKLAFVCDSTAAPVSSLIVLNGWGALLLGLIATQIENGLIEGKSVDWLISAVGYNFYAISALIVTFVSIWFSIDIGAMKHAKVTPNSTLNIKKKEHVPLYYMLLPIVLMILFVFLFLYISGEGDIFAGSGSSAIFYTMLATLFVMYFLYVVTGDLTNKEYFLASFKGAKKLFVIAFILLLAFAIGKVTVELKTGLYLASLINDNFSVYLLSAVVFLLSALIAFSTGTSWGTFSIMIPIAVPMAVSVDANIALAMGAVISGGVFGDHCSPISDTTIISSLASDCDVVEHVKTQLPYALISGAIAFVLFILFSYIV
jgi:Na+/H+ antiporter NhaC